MSSFKRSGAVPANRTPNNRTEATKASGSAVEDCEAFPVWTLNIISDYEW